MSYMPEPCLCGDPACGNCFPNWGAPREPIEAICNDCGQEFAGGCIEYRTLDAFDNDPEPYCPQCDGSNLRFPIPRER